jgi:hypothetical protein
MKKIVLSLFALLFLAPLVPAASAQVNIHIGPHRHRHCYYRYHHRHCYYR